ncbi:jerky [Penicillium bovifimosum]|uniref:Jerky n=1 Tax=Penicillium bovifimosum TaxID=126998 RepID=A0A9W9H672_9EURO|nr:jerky [Penicillium bovifimosum]KAJ5138426.1 jerky [Penicillium bovifimosum]
MPRQSISNRQRATLREQHRLRPQATQKQLADWYFETYGHRPTLSTVSVILSSKFQSRYWSDRAPLEREALPRLAFGETPTSQEIIREKARFFWNQLPAYEGMEMPIFSNGWLAHFKIRALQSPAVQSAIVQNPTSRNRQSIWNRTLSGEVGSTPAAAAEAMIQIRQVLEAYDPKDIFTCDETALFWKRLPDQSLAAEPSPRQKQQKAKITALFCCNADGSEKLQPWFIGTAQQPRAFTAAHININNLDLRWKSNMKAWMDSKLFEEWLRWFDQQMIHRKVVLLMDNFSAHEPAVRATINEFPSQLQNTLIIWLPGNSTSRFQPLDQGIIRTWKAHWRREWIEFMLDEFDNGRDPIQSMNVLKALRWAISAWQFGVSAETISTSFKKALGSEYQSETIQQPLATELSAGLSALRLRMSNPMSLESFLNPLDEIVQDDQDTLDNIVLSQFHSEFDDDADIPEAPLISAGEALQAVETVLLYELQQEQGDREAIHYLQKQQGLLQAKIDAQKQRDIRALEPPTHRIGAGKPKAAKGTADIRSFFG